MKKLYTISLIPMLAIQLNAQQGTDTLVNHQDALPLSIEDYTGNNQWGYYSGMSHKRQQQFGERYEIAEHGDVVGIIVHVNGIVTNIENEAHVRVFDVATDGMPGTEIEHGHVHFHDLNLDGTATVVMLDDHAHVDDAFFATFDIGDYAHGGYEGDTIGVLTSPDGSRATSDLSTLYRNVVQEHSHGSVVWADFYTGNNTPIATHFAIYPIIEFEEHATGIEKQATKGILSISSPFPIPAIDNITIPYNTQEKSAVEIIIYDMQGKQILTSNLGQVEAGYNKHTVNISNLENGNYILATQTPKGSLAIKIIKQ